MLFFHVSNCCSHHRNVIWSPRGGEVVCETICLLEVIYKAKEKLGIWPLVTSLLSMQRKSRRAFADLLPPLLSPDMPHEHMYQHTRAHLHPLLKWGTETLFMLQEGTSGSEQHHHDKPNLGTAHAALQALRWGRTTGDRFCCHFVAWDFSTDFLEISPWHSAAPDSHTLQYRLYNRRLPFQKGSYTAPKKEQRCPCKDAVPKQSLRFNTLQASSATQGSLSLSQLLLTAALALLWHVQYRQWWIQTKTVQILVVISKQIQNLKAKPLMADWIRKISRVHMLGEGLVWKQLQEPEIWPVWLSSEKIHSSEYPANFSTVLKDEILPDFKNK